MGGCTMLLEELIFPLVYLNIHKMLQRFVDYTFLNLVCVYRNATYPCQVLCVHVSAMAPGNIFGWLSHARAKREFPLRKLGQTS